MKMTTCESLHQQIPASKIHLERIDHRFRILIKSAVVCRKEESPAIEASPGQDQMLSLEIEVH